jgi:hypothetical protein
VPLKILIDGNITEQSTKYRGLAGRAHHSVMRAPPPKQNEALQLYTKAIITRFSGGEVSGVYK